MKAALFEGPKKGIRIGEIEKPTPGPRDILVKIKCSSLCHSDFTLLDDPNHQESVSRVPGHEATGYIEELGSEVTGFKKGDAVGFLLHYGYCGECKTCSVSPVGCPSNKTQGFAVDGYFAEYAKVDSRSAMKLPEGLDIVPAAPLFCAGLTAYHAVVKCGLQPGDWIGIVGVGGLSHLALQYAAKMGMKPIALDVDDSKLHHTREIGAVKEIN
ncbi:hypothetical protein KCU71_g3399, partial [Aureobasidium melanogenum]